MTTFVLKMPLAKWMHQNKAEYTGDFVEGCLLDNFVVETRRGFAAIYEQYATPNSSVYRVEFEPGTAQNVFARWYKFYDACNMGE